MKAGLGDAFDHVFFGERRHGDENRRAIAAMVEDLLRQFEAIHARHAQVGENRVWSRRFNVFEGIGPIPSREDLVPVEAEQGRSGIGGVVIVIDDHDRQSPWGW
ncbi:MAG TPA: hypothetical protein VN641_12935 [Urbifossiella sp.]|nr:hypothetical protein [Urbifossiella sp.]